jgi:hypothetical protein
MKTAAENRLEWLELLIQKAGSIALLNVALGRDRTDATLSQIRSKSLHTTTGAPRKMGDKIARGIECVLKMPCGTLDNPPTMADFQNRLAWAMAQAKVSTNVLASHLGVSYQAIRKLELGTSKAMNAANNELTASFLGVNSYWLATGEGPRLPVQQGHLGEEKLSACGGPQVECAPDSASQWPFKSFNQADWMHLPQDSRVSLEVQIRAVIDAFLTSSRP